MAVFFKLVNHRTHWAIGVFVGLMALSLTAYSQGDEILAVGKFSAGRKGGAFPPGWKPLTFKKIEQHTKYSMVSNNGTVVVKAVSNRSSSGLIREITIDPKEYPIIEWRWKVENVLKNGDVTSKEGDDYPARIYITFEYDSSKVGIFEKAKYETINLIYGQYPPIGAINYIWDSKSPVGTMVPNPFTDRVRMIVTQSGSEKLNEWVTEEHNVFEDFTKAFGENPPRISGLAIMTDTDNTKESAVAYFGDIVFKKRRVKSETD